MIDVSTLSWWHILLFWFIGVVYIIFIAFVISKVKGHD